VGELYTYQIPDSTFLDPDSEDTLTYSSVFFPAWLSFDPVTRTISGVPPSPTTTPLNLRVQATDIFQATAQTTFSLVAYGDCHIPVYPGWNHVSVPSIQTQTAQMVFPGKSGNMFWYDSNLRHYKTAQTLDCGPGYWVKYTQTDTITIHGNPSGSTQLTISQPGWVLIGSRGINLPLSSLVLTNGATILGSGMRYNPDIKDYEMIDVLKPGEACWIKISNPCTITIPE
jgi:hypothetical protein